MRGRPEAFDDVDDVRLRAARGVSGDDTNAAPGGDDDDTEDDDDGGDVFEDGKLYEEAPADKDGDEVLDTGSDGLGTRAAAPEPPVAVLPLATDDTDRALATDVTDRADRTEWIDAFDAARSRCSTEEDTDPGTATDVGGLVLLFPWRVAIDRSDDVEAVFGIPEDVRDCGRGMALGGVDPVTLRAYSVGRGGSAFDTGRGAELARRITRGTGTDGGGIMVERPDSSSLVRPEITGLLDLPTVALPTVKCRRPSSPADELGNVGVGLRSSSREPACW